MSPTRVPTQTQVGGSLQPLYALATDLDHWCASHPNPSFEEVVDRLIQEGENIGRAFAGMAQNGFNCQSDVAKAFQAHTAALGRIASQLPTCSSSSSFLQARPFEKKLKFASVAHSISVAWQACTVDLWKSRIDKAWVQNKHGHTELCESVQALESMLREAFDDLLKVINH